MTTVINPSAVLVDADPRTMIVGANVRLDARLDKDFVDSIRERGVLQPIVAYRGDDDELVVVRGQRRILGAIEAGRPTVPVVVYDRPDEADRLVDQLAENDHRTGLDTREHVAAFQQLSALGVPAGQIAKKTARPQAAVDAALVVAGSELASKATERYDFLTLDHAAALAEFQDDGEAVKRLVVSARDGGFDHQLQRLRDERDMAAEKARLTAELTESGLTVIDRPPYGHKKIQALEYLKVGKKNATAANHGKCPGHAAFVAETYSPKRGYTAQYACTDFPKHGHDLRYPSSAGAGRTAAADMSLQERADAAAERRDVIRCNKESASAETVRRAWLRTFMARNAAPKGTAGFVALSLARADHQLGTALSEQHRLARELLGLPELVSSYKDPEAHQAAQRALTDLVGKASDGRAQMISLGLVLAGYESGLARDFWRRNDTAVTRYLRFLQTHGYELSAVELRACGVPPTAGAEAAAEEDA